MRVVIMFEGLIAFIPKPVPNKPPRKASSLTAYLVPMAHHTPKLTAYGDLEVIPPVESSSKYFLRELEEDVFQCDLEDVDVELLGIEGKEEHDLAKTSNKTKPDTPEEKKLLDWLVRVEEVEAGKGTSKKKDELKRPFGNGFSFVWDSAEVAHLDGEELGGSRLGDSKFIQEPWVSP